MQTCKELANEDDIVFIGLTAETADEVDKIDAWVESLEIPWAIGYGAGHALVDLEIPGYPTTFVIGRDGKVLWHSFLNGSLDRAIQDAL